MDALNPEEAFRMRQFMIAQASRLDNIHYQHELGLIDDDFYESTFKETVRDQGTFLKRVGVLQTRRASLVAAVDRILAEGNTDGGF